MDILSEALARIQIRCGLPGTAELTAPWGFRLTPPDPQKASPILMPDELHRFLLKTGAKFAAYYVVTSGQCLLEQPGNGKPLELSTGDLAILTRTVEHQVRDGPPNVVRPLFDYIDPKSFPLGPRLQISGGGSPTSLLFGVFVIHGYIGTRLLDSLPYVLHLNDSRDQTSQWLPQLLQIILTQSQSIAPGSLAVIDRLVQVMFCQAVRYKVSKLGPQNRGPNWLSACLDTQIGSAISAMHERLQKRWTVESLAAEVAMSRSAFASKFTNLVGVPPLTYLSNIRMECACELLAGGGSPIKEISHEIGYASEAAFSTAFRRQFDLAPIDFRRKSFALRDHRRENVSAMMTQRS